MPPKTRILIIDDEDAVLKTLSQGLTVAGYDIETAMDGEEGLHKVGVFRPDYVMVDCLMPRIDGFEFCRILQGNTSYSNIKIIMMSAIFTDAPFIKETVLKYNPHAFLVKPIDISELVKFLKNQNLSNFVTSESKTGDQGVSRADIKKLFKTSGKVEDENLLQSLFYIHLLQETGILTVEQDGRQWLIYFYQGIVVKSVSNITDEFFGNIAVKNKIISEADRNSCLEDIKNTKNRIGETLIKLGKIDKQKLNDILGAQAEIRLNRISMLDSGVFNFQHASVKKVPRMYFKISIVDFFVTRLFSGFEKYVLTKIEDYFQFVPQVNQSCLVPQHEYCVTSLQRDVLSKINGEKTVEELLKRYPNQSESVLRYIYSLILIKAISFGDEGSEGEHFYYLKEQLAKFRKIQENNKFGVLGVTKTSSDGDVKKAYLSLAKEFHPDKNLNYQHPKLKKMAENIFNIITDAYNTLVTEEKRHNYSASLQMETDKITADTVFSADNEYSDGLRFFNKNMFGEAAQKFRQLVKLHPDNLDYKAYLAWAILYDKQKTNISDYKDVERLIALNFAVSSEHPLTHLVAGYVAMAKNDQTSAMEQFNQVLKFDEANVDAKREIKIMIKRKASKKLLKLS